MSDRAKNLLLVEDDDSDAVLLRRHLEPELDRPLTRVTSLGRATEVAQMEHFDLVVLDLALPDAWGLDAILRFSRRVPNVPIVVVSGTQEPAFAEKARRAGAVGFVSKTLAIEEIASEILALASADSRPPGADELRDLTRVGRGETLSATAHIYGRRDLVDADPQLWEHYIARYNDLLDLVLEQAAFRTELNVHEHLRAFADELGGLRAGPRDVISIHTAAVRRRIEAANGMGVDAILSEARLAVLEAMGYLAEYYRTAALGVGHDEVSGGLDP